MSKVKTDFGIRKNKLKRSLRRMESKRKKQERIFMAKEKRYRFMVGYYVRKEKPIGHYEWVTIPERTEWKGHFEKRIKKIENMDGTFDYVEFPVYVKDKLVTIPAKMVWTKVNTHYENIPEMPIRINTGMKKYRKMAQRKLRRNHKLTDYQGSDYKKVAEVYWEYI